MVPKLDPNVVMGGRAMQIVADNHPERFTYENGHLFLDGSTIGDPLTNALRPDTLLKLIRRATAQEPVEPMTDARAKVELDTVKEIIDRHADAGWLACYGHDLNEGFFYSYWDGRYEARAEQEKEDAA